MASKAFAVGILLVFGLLARAAAAQTMDVTKDVKEAQETIAVFKKADPGLSRFFDNAVGYAVFPTVTKGAVGVGGAPGPGGGWGGGQARGQWAGVAPPGHPRRPGRWLNLLGSHLLRDGAGVDGLQEGDVSPRGSGERGGGFEGRVG